MRSGKRRQIDISRARHYRTAGRSAQIYENRAPAGRAAGTVAAAASSVTQHTMIQPMQPTVRTAVRQTPLRPPEAAKQPAAAVRTARTPAEQKPQQAQARRLVQTTTGAPDSGVKQQRPAAKSALEESLADLNRMKQVRGTQKRRSVKRIVLGVLAGLLVFVLTVMGGMYLYILRIFDEKGEGGGGELIKTETMTPPELAQNQINFLVLGLDYMEDDAVQRDESTMLSDMVLYCQFNKKEQTMKMLQIPRDIYVQQSGYQGNAKINGLYSFGPDRVNKVQNVVDAIYDMFKLPVDYYITVKMEALKELTNTFGGGSGLEVYVPKTLEYDGSRLEQGWQMLKGDSLEFFLRCRKGPGMERSDYDRLENQKYFYSALFRYMRTMSVPEMIKIIPVGVKYVNTNMPIDTCIALGIQFLSGGIPDENIVMGRIPVYGVQVTHTPGNDVTILPKQETADFLNRYFRPADAPVDASELNLPVLGNPSQWGGVSEGTLSAVSADGQIQNGGQTIDNQQQDTSEVQQAA